MNIGVHLSLASISLLVLNTLKNTVHLRALDTPILAVLQLRQNNEMETIHMDGINGILLFSASLLNWLTKVN